MFVSFRLNFAVNSVLVCFVISLTYRPYLSELASSDFLLPKRKYSFWQSSIKNGVGYAQFTRQAGIPHKESPKYFPCWVQGGKYGLCLWIPRNEIIASIRVYLQRPGREADHSPPSSAEVKQWVELYLHSPSTPSWRAA